MNKLFLDCGTHLGQGLESIGQQIGVDQTWTVHSWEANPYTFELLDHTTYPDNYYFYNQAISDHNGTVTLNVESIQGLDTGQGSSIMPQDQWVNPMHKGTFTKSVQVQSIDISEWILANCCDTDHIVVKLDIEGAEYSVLPKMIKDCSIDLVDSLFIEWHARFFPNKEHYWQLQDQLIETLRSRLVNIIRWS